MYASCIGKVDGQLATTVVSCTFFSQTHKQVGKFQFYGLEIYLKKDCILVSMDNPYMYVPTVGNSKFLSVLSILKKGVRGKGHRNLLVQNHLIHVLPQVTL